MNLSDLQDRIVNTDKTQVVVLAAAAAGKTSVLTERVRKLLNNNIVPSDIAVITFTNLAAQELRDRLGADYKDGIYIGTIHGLANKFLLTHGIETGRLIEKEDFDGFFRLLKQNPGCITHIPHILLDEAQDTSELEFEFIFDMICPKTFFVVGDFRQTIYSFKGSEPELLLNLSEKEDVTTYSLNENYRNGANILTYAKKILRKSGLCDDSIPVRENGIVYEGETDFTNLKGWISSQGEFKDWAILCSTNTDIAYIIELCNKNNIPTVTFKQGDLSKAQLDKLMKTNAVKVLTRHSAKGLEFDNVAVWAPQWWGGDEAYRVNYVAATRARNILLWLEAPKKKKNKRKYF